MQRSLEISKRNPSIKSTNETTEKLSRLFKKR